ncbi:MAG: putative RNA uridine N3 methyltransferase, partial [Desulfurococcaceae archaeon]
NKDSLLILFGSPKHGLYELASAEGFSLEEKVNVVWRTIVNQMVKTVRTEEALIGTLTVINMFINAS